MMLHPIGYWINIGSTYSPTFAFESGLQPCESYSISAGNNLLSYKLGENYTPTLDALGGETFATDHFNFIIGQGVGLFNTGASWSGNLNNLIEGKGYWVNVTSTNFGDLACDGTDGNEFCWGFDNCSSLGSMARQDYVDVDHSPEIPEELKFIQSTEQAFYLVESVTVDGNTPKDGDVLLAYNNDILVGSVLWGGENTPVPVMGRDLSEQTAGFCEPGDQVSFKLFDSGSGEILPLEGLSASWGSLLVTSVANLTATTVEIPEKLTISPAFPNPFNPVTVIHYGLPNDGHVNIDVYDISGRLISNLLSAERKAGQHSIEWDAGIQPSGIYFMKTEFGHEVKTTKLMLVK